MSNVESQRIDSATTVDGATNEPDLAKIERDLAEIELMLERLG
jgi:hypothetical protein